MKSRASTAAVRVPEEDAAASLLERRWFASLAAVRSTQAECELLREVLEMAEVSWRRARRELAHLEALHDALGRELAEIDGPARGPRCVRVDRAVSTAA